MARSWLEEEIEKRIQRLPKREFSPTVIFDFDHIRAAIALVEGAIEASQEESAKASHAAAIAAARDPNHNFTEQPIFAPMAVEYWAFNMTFPLILRRSVFIAICSHFEHVLYRWCDFLNAEWKLNSEPRLFEKKKRNGENTPFVYLRYLREVAGLALNNFENGDDWKKFDAYWRARNCLVHSAGVTDDAELRAVIAPLEHIMIDESGLLIDSPFMVHLLPGACEDAAVTAKQIIKELAELTQQGRDTSPT